jgi:hypothetical protein
MLKGNHLYHNIAIWVCDVRHISAEINTVFTLARRGGNLINRASHCRTLSVDLHSAQALHLLLIMSLGQPEDH